MVDSTCLKIIGAGEWPEQKPRIKRKQRSWRKLHLGLDLVSGEIVCSDLTCYGVGESTALTSLLDQIDGPVDLFLTDGAYDGDPTRDLLVARYGAEIDVAIPTLKNTVLSMNAVQKPMKCDRQITDVTAYGRMAWQKTPGYNQRSHIETQTGRWKAGRPEPNQA